MDATEYWLTRFCFQRSLGFVYVIGFLIAANQFRPLLGQRGLLPVPLFLKRVKFRRAPSLFHLHYSDGFLTLVAWSGILLGTAGMTGVSEWYGTPVSMALWAVLWLLYLSLVNVGQRFYGYGWESVLLETGFLAIFLGAADTEPPEILVWMLRWVLFRLMYGAGLIKLRGDRCWRDLTCLAYHYETQPLPNPLSWYLHRMPMWFHKLGVLFTHFVELIVPFGFFAPAPICYIAGGLTILLQLMLIFSGNLSWLNYITLVLCVSCFDDALLSYAIPISPAFEPRPLYHDILVYAVAGLVGLLSIRPISNLLSSGQRMNVAFDPLHLVNTYGAFGSITRRRMEIVIEGTDDVLSTATQWREYEFKGKPGDVRRRPCIVSPYHWRLDWQMWFAAMSSYHQHPWFLHLVAKLLQGDRAVSKLLGRNPFPDEPPKYIRAICYSYRFTDWAQWRETGAWWSRVHVGEYLRPLSLDDAAFQDVLQRQGWTG